MQKNKLNKVINLSANTNNSQLRYKETEIEEEEKEESKKESRSKKREIQ